MRRKLSISAIFVALITWVVWTNINITTTAIEIENKKIPPEFDGFTIAHVSDLHNHPWGERLIDKIEREQPNLIAITGDLVDASKTDFDIALQFIEEVSEIAPIYYVTGNHEAWLEDYSILKTRLEKADVNMMDDQAIVLERGSSGIQILGIQDPDFVARRDGWSNQSEIVRTKASEQLDQDYFSIILSHRPEHFEQYVDVGADLVLTGHAHGGQVRIPFLGGVVAPNQGFFPKYTAGVYTEESTSMIVSRGLGNSVIPIRVNNTPELVIVRLQAF